MYNFDSLSLKYFFEENENFIRNSVVQKIHLPSRHEIILNLRNIEFKKNEKLYININPKYPHICFIDEKSMKLRNIEIPKVPPMFCMQLRKYLNGSKIKDFKLVKYERILELYFDYFDEIGSLTRMCLALEFMGKHSNVILYNAQNRIIIGSIHNVSKDKSSIREIYGGINYIYPPMKEKLDLLNTSYSTFFEIAKEKDVKKISSEFYYFSQNILNSIFEKNLSQEDTFSYLQNLESAKNPDFIVSFWLENKEKDFEKVSISAAIDKYFSSQMFLDISSSMKSRLKNLLNKEIKKISKVILNCPNEEKHLLLKKKADYIMTFMYSISLGQKELLVEDLKIELDENLTPNENAQKYYEQYKKAKGAFEYWENSAKLAKEKLEYFNSILFNIENSSNFEELNEIIEEMAELGLYKNNKENQGKKKKDEEKIHINKIEFMGYTIYIGKNNVQNDYLISKIAKNEDLWFHGLNFPSAHIILKLPKGKNAPPKEVLEYCAKITKENSKAKNSSKVSIIMTKRQNLKKPPNTYLGYVTYKNETEIVIE